MTKLNIYITEYYDNTLSLECKHMHYAFTNKYDVDNIKRTELYDTMYKLQKEALKENIILNFILR